MYTKYVLEVHFDESFLWFALALLLTPVLLITYIVDSPVRFGLPSLVPGLVSSPRSFKNS